MKICDYCGKLNEDASISCSECGSCLALTDENSSMPPPRPVLSENSRSRVLNARSATLILGAYLAPAIVFGVFQGILFAMHDRATLQQNIPNGQQSQYFVETVMPLLNLMLPLVSGLVTVFVARAMIPDYLSNTSPTGAAWKRGSWMAVVKGLGIGLALGASCCALNILLRNYVIFSHVAVSDLQASDQLAFVPGFQQLFWLLAGVLFPPVAEEILFRGVLYGGYRRSFGGIAATLITTSTFVLLHITDVIRFFPSFVALAALGLAAQWCRLRSGAIGPSVAVHIGYNTVLSLVMIWPTWR